MNRIIEIIKESWQICQKSHLTAAKRFTLLLAYKGLAFRRFLHGRFYNYNNRVLHLTIGAFEVQEFMDFYWTFHEVFILEDYRLPMESLKEDPYLIDGGANIGVTTRYFKWLYRSAKVVAFEPHPETLAIFRNNLELGHCEDVEVASAALAGEAGTITLYGTLRAATISAKHKDDRTEYHPEGKYEEEHQVATVKLSTYLEQPVDYLKLDIEGAEREVLAELSASGRLEKVRNLGMEYHPLPAPDQELTNLVGYLKGTRLKLRADHGITLNDFDNNALPRHFMIYASSQ